MSGFAGFVRLDGARASREDLDAMVAAMAHRARGGVGVLIDGPVALAQLGAPTVPESAAETEPVRAGALLAAGDVRLDGRSGLRVELSGGPGEAPGDLELAARAFARWGDGAPARLDGDLAMVVWDPARRVLTCVRDRFGTRPFVYHRGPRLFAFASQPAGVLGHPGVPRRVDERAIAGFLQEQVPGERATFWQELERLPPAHVLAVEAGERSAPWRYWSPEGHAEVRLGTDAEYEEAFRATFLDAVRARLRSSVPVGLGLSGGLDSTAVVGAARSLEPGAELACFSVVFADPRADERRFVEAAAAALGVAPVLLDASDLGVDLDAFGEVDAPYTISGRLMDAALFRLAASHGVGVFLDGFDGDTVVSHGLGRLTDLALQRDLGTLWTEAGLVGERTGAGRWRTLRAEVAAPLLPASAVAGYRRVRHGAGADAGALASIADPGFLARVGVAPPAPGRPRWHDVARREHLGDVGSAMNVATLEVLEHAAARAGVELRHPFFSRALVEFCLGLPAEQILRDGWTRSIQRRALAGLVPDAVRWRPDKARLGAFTADPYLVQAWPMLTDLARTRGGAAAPYLDADALRSAYRAVASGAADDRRGALWSALELSTWLRNVS